MEVVKLLRVIAKLFLIAFLISALLIVTNLLNMWLVGIISLPIAIILFVVAKIIEKKGSK